MNLKYIKSIAWDEAFSEWEKSEANLPRWIEHYKERGFNSWKEWRNASLESLNPQSLTWVLYEIQEPLTIVPTFYAGPFRPWIKKYYGNKEIITFEELATNVDIQNDANIDQIIHNFPNGGTLLGLLKKSEVIIIDGMHRCAALAVANKKNMNLKIKISLICAEFNEELPMLGQINSPT